VRKKLAQRGFNSPLRTQPSQARRNGSARDPMLQQPQAPHRPDDLQHVLAHRDIDRAFLPTQPGARAEG
jgi:hypothetical protein